MPVSDTTKLDWLWKKLAAIRYTTSLKAYYDEDRTKPGGIDVNFEHIWRPSTSIPSTPPGGDTADIDVIADLVLTEDLTVAGHKAWKAESGGSPLDNWIPPQYGVAYSVVIKDSGGSPIPLADASVPYFDYQSGILFFENTPTWGTPPKISGYRYIGPSGLPDVEELGTSLPVNQVPYSNGSNLVGDPAFLWKPTYKQLFINRTAAPPIGATEAGIVAYRNLWVLGDNEDANLRVFSFGKVPQLLFHQTGGTETSPVATSEGEEILHIRAVGCRDNVPTWGVGARIKAEANQNWAPGAYGTRLILEACPDDSVTLFELLRLRGTNTKTAPIISIAGDVGSGIWREYANHIGFSANGNRVLDLYSSAVVVNEDGITDCDFRVEGTGGKPKLLFVDTSLNKVSIGDGDVDGLLTLAYTTTGYLLVLHNKSAADGRSAMLFTADRTSTRSWVLGVDAQGGDSKAFDLYDATGAVHRWRVTTDGFFGFNTYTPAGVLDIYRETGDLYAILRTGNVVDLNVGAAHRFVTAAPGATPGHTNIIADIRGVVHQRSPNLQGRLDFFTNTGDSLTSQARLVANLGLRLENTITGNPAARLHVVELVGTLPSFDPPYGVSGIIQRNSVAADSCRLLILAGNTGQSSVLLGDADDADRGAVTYDHADDRLHLVVAGTSVVQVSSSLLTTALEIQTSNHFTSTLATGTAPVQVSSTTLCANLNADLLDGFEASAFASASHGASAHTGNIFPSANQNLGAYYLDIAQIGTPANPGAGVRRLFCDSGTGELSVRTSAGTTVSLEGAGGGAHNLLSATHTDTTAATPPGVGSVIRGSAANKWEELAANATATNKFLRSVSSGVATWEQVAWADIDKTVSSLADLTTVSASAISSGLLAVAYGGTGLSSGTSGGILGYTGAGTLASSVELPANRLVLGGGAGATPTPLGSLGTVTTVLHGNAAGAPSFAQVDLTTTVTGALPIANGGSGQITQQTAINALTNVGAATNEHVLTKDTATGNAIFKAAPGGGSVSGSGATSQVAFWTGSSTLSGDNLLWWNNSTKQFCVGTSTPMTWGASYPCVLTVHGAIGFDSAGTGSPVARIRTEITGDVVFASTNHLVLAIDALNTGTGSAFEVMANNAYYGGGTTLLRIDEFANVSIGSYGVTGSIGFYFAGGSTSWQLGYQGSPTSSDNRARITNPQSAAGGDRSSLEFEQGCLTWLEDASFPPTDFAERQSLITQYIWTGVPVLVTESLGGIEFVLDSDNDETTSVFRVSRNDHFSTSLAYLPGAGFYGEKLFWVTQAGHVMFRAWEINRKAITGNYTLDTWVDGNGADDLLLAATSIPGGGLTITIPAAAAGNANRTLAIKDESGTAGTNSISVSQNVDGASGSNLVNSHYGSRIIYSSGSGWFSLTPAVAGGGSYTPPSSWVSRKQGTGKGSVNTNVVIWNAANGSAGSDISYINSSSNGDSFKVNVAGCYAVSLTVRPNAASSLGMELCRSTSINDTMGSSDVITISHSSAADQMRSLSWTGYCAQNDLFYFRLAVALDANNDYHNQITIIRLW